MARKFPPMVPTTRSFTMGDFPSTTYRSLSGAIFKRSFGNVQTGYKIDLVFKNIGDVNEIRSGSGTAKKVVDHYNAAKGSLESFTLPDQLFNGMSELLEGRIQSPANVKWRYAKPPKVQSVQSGISTVTVSLVGEIEA